MEKFNPDIIDSTVQIEPPRILVYGESGIGKTTFAANAPSPFVLDFEGGSKMFSVARVSKQHLTSSKVVLEALRYLYQEEHQYKTVVIDTVDWLERIICDEIAKQHGAKSIDDHRAKSLSFGRGITAVTNQFRVILNALDYLVQHRDMTVILCCHHKIKRVDEPDSEGYDVHTLKLHDKVRELIQEWCDCIFFAKLKVHVTTSDGGFSKAVKKGHTGEVVMRTKKAAAYLAKNRYDLPEELPLDFKVFWTEFASKTGYNHAAIQPAKAKTANVVPIKATTTTTPNMGVPPAAQYANGAYSDDAYLEL